jgi:hypothetical protein
MMRTVLIFAALAEFATGVALLIAPSIIVQLLLGQSLVGVAILIARVTGIALVALAIACWPGPAQVGMLTYSAGMTVFLGYAGYTAGATGALIWPAVGLHGVLTAALLWSFAKGL